MRRLVRTVRFICHAFCVALLITHLFPLSAFAADYVPNEVLVTFRHGVTADEIALFENRHGLTLKRAFRFDPRHRHYLLPPEVTVEEALVKLGADPVVESVTPNFLAKPLAFPTDPRFPEQWYLHNTGQAVNGQQGPADIDINWPEAMDLFTGSAEVIVAVLDSGISGFHPELAFSVWVNSDEINGNGIDDDGNGYVDDRLGWDFVDNDGLPLDEGPGGGHGTLVASVIAAGTNNGLIGAGIAPAAKIMPLRIANDYGSIDATTASVVAALEYAGMNGARIANLSFHIPPTPSLASVLQWLDSIGVLVVAAAGNGGLDRQGDDNDLTPVYPGSYPFENIISVAAVDRAGNLAPFSNYGANSVDLAAPGTDILGAALKYQTFALETFQTGAPGWQPGQMPGSASTLPWSLWLWPDGLGNYWYTDSLFPGTNSQISYQPFTNSYLLSPPYFLPPGGAKVMYRVLHDLAPFDFLVLEVSADGTNWQFIDLVYGIGLGQRTADVSRFGGQSVLFRFRLWSDGIFQGGGVAIDDFEIQGVALTTYDGTEFQFDNGTSFAAPQVAGVAAMLLSQRPDLTHRQVRDIILNGVTKTTVLNGKVATGGQLNALAALQAAIAMPGGPSPLSTVPGSLNFINQRLGVTSAPLRVTLRNNGITGASVDVTGVAAGGDFSRSTNCGGTLAVGASCFVDVTLTPSAAGPRFGELVVNTTLPDSPLRIGLVGNRNAGAFVDFDGSGHDDLLWRHPASGTNLVWLMRAGAVTDNSSLFAVPSDWQVAGVADFDGNGSSDLLWRHPAGGYTVVWLMAGGAVVGGGALFEVPSDWQVAGTGDFDGDGRADILWRHPAGGYTVVWLVNGLSVVGGGPLFMVPGDWQVAGVADFDGNGSSDLLWRHPPSGSTVVWLMDRGAVVGGGALFTVPSDWQVVGTGDFNGDGRADILWRHPAGGHTVVWLMQGAAVVAGGALPTVPLPWTIMQVSDFDADGRADILWRVPESGANVVWLMNGLSPVGATVPPAAPSDWEVMP